MLSHADNELLTRVGPGTPMGETLRRYWIPALLSDEVAEPDGPPVRVKLLGEELVAFRDSEGRIGLLDEFCAHRGASLIYARNEDCGLRCIYHGWKYDVSGLAVETPNEPGARAWEGRLRQTAYPTCESGGVIWTYMGPAECKPAFTRFPFDVREHVTVVKVFLDCSYLQSIEGGIDSSHLSFLHRSAIEAAFGPLATRDASPRIELQDMPYGFRYAALRNADDGEQYVRITPIIMPFMTMVPFQLERPQAAHIWVPIDDEHNHIFTFNWMHEDQPFPSAGSQGYELDGRFTKRRTRANQHLQDREAMKAGNWSGIKLIPDQDAVVQESMRPIVDRSREHLGQADLAVIHYRALLLAAVRAVQEGRDPLGVGSAFPPDQICSVVTVAPTEKLWRELGLPLEAVAAGS
jgi:nitrite reductase/ring-hydroxylating ferredoxin subunit